MTAKPTTGNTMLGLIFHPHTLISTVFFAILDDERRLENVPKKWKGFGGKRKEGGGRGNVGW